MRAYLSQDQYKHECGAAGKLPAPGFRRTAPKVSRRNVGAEIADRGLDAAFAMGNAERLKRDLDDAQRAQHHRRVDVAHMGDPERLAGQLADSDAEHHAAFLLAVTLQLGRVVRSE